MVTWLRNPSAAKIFVTNEISVSLQKKKALIEWGPNWIELIECVAGAWK